MNNSLNQPSAAESASANRHWWDLDAEHYHEEHKHYLTSFYWCPEMLHEQDAQLLGDAPGAVLEIGAGSAPCSAWLAQKLAAKDAPSTQAEGENDESNENFVIAFDLSMNMLKMAPDSPAILLQADAQNMPFKDESFDTIFSVFGAIPFVADSAALMKDVARLLKPGGRFVFSVTHPMRWIFPDDPTEAGLTVYTSYFDRTPYTERDPFTGEFTYVEHHRTMGDRINELIGAGLVLDRLIEPEWPEDLNENWGQWSRLRGELFPGTAIFVAHKPAK
ncbi:MAG: class I SAM-dependent methyltransferase [Corynebacterium sp.]|nr:class I SAM-dependent methyltransferase [Corynebacterium sp.]